MIPDGAQFEEYVSSYLRTLEAFPGGTCPVPVESLRYFFDSKALNIPGNGMPSQVESDLPRFSSIRFNNAVVYDRNTIDKVTLNAKQIFATLSEAIGDPQTAINCSKLLTQATLGEPATNFHLKFSNENLEYSMTNQVSTDIVLNTVNAAKEPLEEIELFFHLILGIHDRSKIETAKSADDLYVQGYCLITRTIVIARESLKLGVTENASVNDIYSPFFRSKEEVMTHLDDQINMESTLKVPQGWHCIIA